MLNIILISFISTTTIFSTTVQTKDTENYLIKTLDHEHITESTTIKNEIQNSSEPINSNDNNLKSIYFYNNFKFNEENVTYDSLVSSIYPRKLKIISTLSDKKNVTKDHKRRVSAMRNAVRIAARQGLDAMKELYDVKEPGLIKKGYFLDINHPATKLFEFSAPDDNVTDQYAKGAYAAIIAAKKLQNSYQLNFSGYGRQAPVKISMRKTPLESFCPPRSQPRCTPASRRYRTHDGTCNNSRKPRWGSAQMPFHRFLAPEYSDGIENMRKSISGGSLASARFISLLVHGSRESDSPVTLMLPSWGQFIDHDITSTAQPRSVNGSVPQCCGVSDQHPSCATIKVPKDDPWLSPLNIRCLEFLRSAPAQRRDCLLSWREQTNQVTSFLDASTIYSSNPITAENVRVFRDGFLLFGRGPPSEDACFRGALNNKCVRPGDSRSGEQPGLLAMHHVLVSEHNRISNELAHLNPHWSDEKNYQEARRIIGAMVQHITYREFLPLVLGRDVCRLFDLELEHDGYYKNYDVRVNPTVANSFSAAAFRFGHSLIQGSYMRSNSHHQFIDNNVTLHEENSIGDIGSPGSLHRLLRGLAMQRAQKRDEFITAELTNHLFQSDSFPFGLDLAAINIQRGRDHGLPSYTQWREPCGLSPIRDWTDLEKIVGPRSVRRIQQGYKDVQDIDLFVAGLAERPVIGGLVGPTFACIIAQQFSNIRRGDRFWYENDGFESSFTPAQLQSIRQVSLAQIICRTIGSGTLQPHIFLPHDVVSNERRPCGFGILAPIDLRPWIEMEPFVSQRMPAQQQLLDTKIRKHNEPIDDVVDKVDFVSNGMTGVQVPGGEKLGQMKLNSSLVNNKLDFTGPNKKRPIKVNSKVRRKEQSKTTTEQATPSTKRTVKTHNRPKRDNYEKRDEFNLTIPSELNNTRKIIDDNGYVSSNRREYSYSSIRPYQNYRPINDGTPTSYQTNRPQNDVTLRPQNYYNNGQDHVNSQQNDISYRPTHEYASGTVRPHYRPQNDNRPYDAKPVHEVQISPQYNTNRPQLQHEPSRPQSLHKPIRPQSDFDRPQYSTPEDDIHEYDRPQYSGQNSYRPKPTKRPDDSIEHKPNYNYSPTLHVTDTNYNSQQDDNENPYHTTFIPQDDFLVRPPNEYNPINIDEPEVYIRPQSPFSTGKPTRRPQNDDSYKRPENENSYNRPQNENSYNRPQNENAFNRPQNDNSYSRPQTVNYRPINNDENLRPDYVEQTLSSTNDISIRPQYSYNTGQTIHDQTSNYRPIQSDDIYVDQHVRPTTLHTDTYNRPDDYLTSHTTLKPMIYLDDFGLTTNNKYSTPFSYDVHTSPQYDDQNSNNGFGYKNKYPNKNRFKPNIYTLDEINGIHKVTTHRPSSGPIRTPLKNPQHEAYTYFTKFLSSLADIFSLPTVTEYQDTLEENKHTRQKDTHELPLIEQKSRNTDTSSTEEDISSDNATIIFDQDGYLRPEHMHFARLNETNNLQLTNDANNKNEEIDDFILPVLSELNDKDSNDKIRAEELDDYILPILNNLKRTEHNTKSNDIKNIHRQRRSDNKKQDRLNSMTRRNQVQNKRNKNSADKPILMVPLEVLTRPERPDNWVMFYSDTKAPLPAVPIIQMGGSVASEIPQPLMNFNKIRKKQ